MSYNKQTAKACITEIGSLKDIYVVPQFRSEVTASDHAFLTCRHVKVVRLRKGRGGLGFVIAGGVGSPLGNLPIFVKEVLVDGAAWKEGQLCRGDEILFVNGIDFRGFTQEHAISALSSIQGDIEMHVLSS